MAEKSRQDGVNNCGAMDYIQSALGNCLGYKTRRRIEKIIKDQNGDMDKAAAIVARINQYEANDIHRRANN